MDDILFLTVNLAMKHHRQLLVLLFIALSTATWVTADDPWIETRDTDFR